MKRLSAVEVTVKRIFINTHQSRPKSHTGGGAGYSGSFANTVSGKSGGSGIVLIAGVAYTPPV